MHITYKSNVNVDTLISIIPTVNRTVAEQLCRKDFEEGIVVTPEMVKIRFSQASDLDSQMPDILVEIEGRAFKSRLGHHEAYATVLSEALAPLLPSHTSYGIWFKLCHAGWKAGTGQLSTVAR